MPKRLSDAGYCLFCDYDLRGLTRDICPECGRSFDPMNPATFNLKRGRTRLRRRIRLLGALCLLAMIGYGAAPRGIRVATVFFHCKRCGGEWTFRREELKPGPWLPIRWPGWTTQQFVPAATTAGTESVRCADSEHVIDKAGYTRGTRAGYTGATVGPIDNDVDVIACCGRKMTPDNADWILRSILSPRASYWIGSRPKDKPEPDDDDGTDSSDDTASTSEDNPHSP